VVRRVSYDVIAADNCDGCAVLAAMPCRRKMRELVASQSPHPPHQAAAGQPELMAKATRETKELPTWRVIEIAKKGHYLGTVRAASKHREHQATMRAVRPTSPPTH